ncbi:hypothetical protein AB5N19_06921 [Seiridium cardinale]|uniref:Uncharacterized protein n=1 Tax=Seiridium cardinale TaxID=138064 RepID=A0ABR2XJW2_9PEZI
MAHPETQSTDGTLLRRLQKAFLPWKWQATQLLIAFGTLASIISVLDRLSGEQQPKWLQGFTLNSLIAILATLLRGTLVTVVEGVISQLKWDWFQMDRPLIHLEAYERASRGPWGALRYMYRIRGLNLATVGALITVISMAIGALTQQAIRSVACSRPLLLGDNAAYVPVAQTLSNDGILSALYPGHSRYTTIPYVDADTRAAVMNGVSQKYPGPVAATCTTGNCTFPERNGISYSSLVIGSSCVDVSSEIEQVTLPTNSIQQIFSNTTQRFVVSNDAVVSQYRVPTNTSLTFCEGCGSLDTTLILQNGTSLNFTTSGQWSTFLNITMNPSITDIDSSSNDPRVLAGFGKISIMMPTTRGCQATRPGSGTRSSGSGNVESTCNQPTLDVDSLPDDFGLMAAVCWLYPGVANINAEVVNGQLIEAQVGELIPLSLNGASIDLFEVAQDHTSLYGYQNPCYIDGLLYDISHQQQLPSNITAKTITDAISNQNFSIPEACLYGIGLEYYYALKELMLEVFDEDQCLPGGSFDNVYDNIMCDSWWLESLWNSRNASVESVSTVMANVATALTNRLRAIGQDFSGQPTLAHGTAMQVLVCTEVNWPWLAFPVGMVLATSALLVGMIARDFFSKEAFPVWKSSLLPLLHYGLEEQSQQQRLMDLGQLSNMAKMTRVRLREGAQGWKFSATDAAQ